jgi:endonuclease/exonuclease/phosphatase family metal-dependent hydrolase
MTIDHGEPKKSRHFTLTDTAYSHLKDIAHEARLSLSETIERLIRTTSPWEGNAVLSDGAFSLVEDHAIPTAPIEDYEGYKVD